MVKISNSPIHVVVGVIFNAQKQILVALRPDDKHQGGLWEFPGGKVEIGEAAEVALHRELHEEVGIMVQKAIPLTQCHYHYEDRHVWLDVWEIQQFSGEAHGKEGQEIAWVSLQQLQQLPVLSANHPIVELIIGTKNPGVPSKKTP